MHKKKVCFIAQFPPPMHGLSKAVETLYNSKLNGNDFEFEKIDITNNKRFVSNLIKISRSKADLFYFTISQTKGGNLRDLIILKLLELQHKKCLIHLHGGYYRYLLENDMKGWQKRANEKAISKLAGAIVLGPSLKWIFEGIIPNEKIFTVPNCVDDEFLLTDDEFAEKLKLIEKENVHHVLWLSNFIRSKGYPIVLEMAKIEKERVDSGKERRFNFDFAGKFYGDDEQKYFESYIAENHLEDYVTYHGVALGEEKKKLLKLCTFFALPTKYPNEGQPISILEALGNGMVIITTNHAGIPDVVQNNVNGIVVDKNTIDIERCYKEMLRCLEEQIKIIALENRRRIKECFNEDIYIRNMERLFQLT